MTFSRSPNLLTPGKTSLLVVDVQQRLVPHIDRYDEIEIRIRTLIEACKLLSVPVAATEQVPDKLGPTVDSIKAAMSSSTGLTESKNQSGAIFSKSMFSCREAFAEIGQQLGWPATADQRAEHAVLLVGVEAHVCILQTALDLLDNGFRVGLVKGAIGSQNSDDCEIALQRMQAAGCEIFSTEGLIFEIAETSKSPVFRELSKLVRQRLHD